MPYVFNPFTGNFDVVNTNTAGAGGSDTEVQFNDGGSLGGDDGLTFDKTTNALTVGASTVDGGSAKIYGDINLDDGGSFSTTVQAVTPTANRTISFPDATGTVALVAGSTGQLTYNNAGSNAGLTSANIGSTGEINISLAGAASTPPVKFTGSWFTGGTSTTTKPQFLIEPTGTTSTSWDTNGTGFGVNAPSGFTGSIFAAQLNGVTQFTVGHNYIAKQVPDGGIIGGNTRGVGAVDLSSSRTSAINVASGDHSFLAASTNGRATGELSVSFNNSVASGAGSFALANGDASGSNSFAAGSLCSASGLRSVAIGSGANASQQEALALGQSSNASGIRSVAINWGAATPNIGQFGYGFRSYGAQWTVMGLVGESTTSSAVELYLEGFSPYQAVVPANTTWAGTATITARTRNGISNALFQRQVMIKRDGSNNTALVGSVQTVGTDIKSDADFDASVTISANDTNEALKVEGTAVVGGTVNSIVSSGTTCTVTMSANHGILTGEYVTIAGANEAAYNGTFVITKTSDTVFTYTAATTPSASPATGTLTANITCRWVCKLDLVQITHSA